MFDCSNKHSHLTSAVGQLPMEKILVGAKSFSIALCRLQYSTYGYVLLTKPLWSTELAECPSECRDFSPGYHLSEKMSISRQSLPFFQLFRLTVLNNVYVQMYILSGVHWAFEDAARLVPTYSYERHRHGERHGQRRQDAPFEYSDAAAKVRQSSLSLRGRRTRCVNYSPRITLLECVAKFNCTHDCEKYGT